MVARYEALAPTFVEPENLRPGSVFETTAPPSPDWRPLNEEADAAFEAWYDEEIPLRDKEGEFVYEMDENGKRVQKMHKPHAQYRRPAYSAADRHSLHIIEGPPPGSGSQDLGIVGVNLDRKPTDQRPGPAPTVGIRERVAGPEGEAKIISSAQSRVKVSA